MARNVSQRGWWHSYASFLHLAFQDFLGLENDASHIQAWHTMLVPGLLQTEEYARALLKAGDGIVHTSADRIDKLVSVRMERKAALAKSPPLQLSVLLSEATLRNTIGDTGTMQRQVEHLVNLSGKANISLRMLPLDRGPHLGLDGPFTLFTFPDGGRLASLEALVNSFYLEDERSVDLYAQAFNQISGLALSEADSVAYLEKQARDI
jgi:hypothetical protein